VLSDHEVHAMDAILFVICELIFVLYCQALEDIFGRFLNDSMHCANFLDDLHDYNWFASLWLGLQACVYVVSGQAAVVRVTADRCAFYGCRFLGWQQLLKNCYVEGSCDFIFGDSTALLEHCHIHYKSTGYITAHGQKSSSEPTGFVFFNRSWEPFGRVLFVETFVDRCIEPAGWHNWDKPENEQTACFYEYSSSWLALISILRRCSGPGSSVSGQ
ncbi:hypothetical protein ACJX0J_031498, partial [Zea mays]